MEVWEERAEEAKAILQWGRYGLRLGNRARLSDP
jgi:hypothetical protein